MQEWLGHSNIATTRLYDRRQRRPEESPTFKDEDKQAYGAGNIGIAMYGYFATIRKDCP